MSRSGCSSTRWTSTFAGCPRGFWPDSTVPCSLSWHMSFLRSQTWPRTVTLRWRLSAIAGHRAVRVLLERLTANRPLVLVLDDVHWADSGSLELLLTLLRRSSTAPILIVCTGRPNLLSNRVMNGLDHAERGGRFVRLQLDPLTLDEARQLLEGAGQGALRADRLHRESGGNPFFLEQLAKAVERNVGGPTSRRPRAVARWDRCARRRRRVARGRAR